MELLKYYGIDWLGTITAITYIYMIGSQKRSGFIIGIVSNICWLIFGIMTESVANIVANVIFIGLNIRGYVKWDD